MKNFKCAIFDLDGTVLDSTDVWRQIDKEFFGKRNIPMPANYDKIIAPMGFEKAAIYTVKAFGLPEKPEDIVAEWQKMSQEKFSSQIKLKPGAEKYLHKLKQRGIILCVATASQESMFAPALKNNNIFHLFDYITTVKEVERGKGFPDVYLKAAEKAGVNVEDCVVFEDIYQGVMAAKDGGFFVVAVYDKGSDTDKEKIKKVSDKFIYDYAEIDE